MKEYFLIQIRAAFNYKQSQRSMQDEDGFWYEEITLNFYKGTLRYLDMILQGIYTELHPSFINISVV